MRLAPALARRRLALAALVVAALAVAACSGAAPAPSGPPASIDPGAVRIAAKDIKFDKAELTAPAGKPFQIAFDNQESAPHNVSIYRDESAAEKVLVEPPFSGPRTEVYSVPALEAGTYLFRCDVHPNMKGALKVG